MSRLLGSSRAPGGLRRPQRHGRPPTPGRPETGEDTDTRETTETGEAAEVGETRDQRGRGVRRDQGDHGHCPSVPTARALLTSPKVENKPDGGGSGLRWEEHDPDAAPDRPATGSREGPRAGSDSSHRRPALPCTLRHGWIQRSSDGIRTSLSNLGLRRVRVLEPRGPGVPSPRTSGPCTVTRQRRWARVLSSSRKPGLRLSEPQSPTTHCDWLGWRHVTGPEPIPATSGTGQSLSCWTRDQRRRSL